MSETPSTRGVTRRYDEDWSDCQKVASNVRYYVSSEPERMSVPLRRILGVSAKVGADLYHGRRPYTVDQIFTIACYFHVEPGLLVATSDAERSTKSSSMYEVVSEALRKREVVITDEQVQACETLGFSLAKTIWEHADDDEFIDLMLHNVLYNCSDTSFWNPTVLINAQEGALRRLAKVISKRAPVRDSFPYRRDEILTQIP